MIKNEIIQILEKYIGTEQIDYISGNVLNVGKTNCELDSPRGSVYGIAIKIDEKDIVSFFDLLKKHNVIDEVIAKEWKSIGNNYYPLYWGKDINMGSRLYSHTKSMKSTGTLQLNKLLIFQNKEIIYGALPCINYHENEKKIRKLYPDILKTSKNNNEDEIAVCDLVPDENH